MSAVPHATPRKVDLLALLGIDCLGEDLGRVEAGLSDAVSCDDEVLDTAARHLLAAGGKRLRPALALTAAYCAAGAQDPTSAPDTAIAAAVAVECIHVASLYHDDVMDEADTRRGVPSVNAIWGDDLAILAGDYLLAVAFATVSALPGGAATLAAAAKHLAVGQHIESAWLFNPDRPVATYETSIAGKTAALMAVSCRLGAMAAGLDDAQVDALETFGHRIGMAFQVVDDVLDVTATDEVLGKPAGNDLREGAYHLPTLFALDSDAGPALRALLGADLSPEDHGTALALVRGSGGVERACVAARDWVAGANEVLDGLEAGPATRALGALGDIVLHNLPH